MRLLSYPVLIEINISGGIFLFFTSGIIIAFFCFAFYLIWNQFLRKDTRLSMGLQILRKKISDLESLALNVEMQVDRQMSMVNERTRRMESLLQKTKELSDHLERNIKIARSLEEIHSVLLEEESNQKQVKESKISSLKEKSAIDNQFTEEHFFESKKIKKLKNVNSSERKATPLEGDKKQKFQFGESPFVNIDFVPSLSKKNIDSSL